MQQKEELDNNTKNIPGVEKIVGYVNSLSNYTDIVIDWTDRRKYEQLIIWLKEDLKIADTCKKASDNLLALINNRHYFYKRSKRFFYKGRKARLFYLS